MPVRPQAFQQGFTLIEILVVVFIVIAVSSVTVIAVRDRNQQSLVDEYVRELSYSLKLAQEETLFRRRTLGLLVDAEGNRFLVHSESGWSDLDDRMLKSSRFPDGVDVNFYIDGDPQVLDVELAEEGEESFVPQVTFIPDAEPVPFELLFNAVDSVQRKIERTPSGRIVTNLQERQ